MSKVAHAVAVYTYPDTKNPDGTVAAGAKRTENLRVTHGTTDFTSYLRQLRSVPAAPIKVEWVPTKPDATRSAPTDWDLPAGPVRTVEWGADGSEKTRTPADPSQHYGPQERPADGTVDPTSDPIAAFRARTPA